MQDRKTTVLALKYRPLTFSALVGQDVLVKTLSNAIDFNRIHHAYLLSGTRGIGKTTTARIIAKALNCVNAPTANPCGICEHCVDIAKGSHPDVFEFDAASNTGIDDVKKLMEGVIYEPIRGKKKVYIIDEVHMLSEKAFNSLLKTLEEPPANVVFIFATTERNEVPITILSRCQKFFLKNLSPEQLFTHLCNICKKEEIEFEAEALQIISQKADGSVRDSLSILDQVIIGSNKNNEGKIFIKTQSVIETINVFNKTEAIELIQNITQNNIGNAMQKINTILLSGFSEIEVITQLMEVINDCLKQKNGINKGGENQQLLDVLSEQNSFPCLMALWQICLKSLRDFNLPGSAKTKLEVLVLKMCYCSTLPSPSELIERLKDDGLNAIISQTNANLA